MNRGHGTSSKNGQDNYSKRLRRNKVRTDEMMHVERTQTLMELTQWRVCQT